MSENLTLESETAVERKEIAPLSSSDLLQHPASDSKQNRTLNELHLFAGGGGGILGGILLGHEPVCAVEIKSYCRETLLQRQRDGLLPRFPIWDDVRTFDGTPWRGIADVVCGGFPCQDISAANPSRIHPPTSCSLLRPLPRFHSFRAQRSARHRLCLGFRCHAEFAEFSELFDTAFRPPAVAGHRRPVSRFFPVAGRSRLLDRP